jgi:aconitate hydratase
VIARSYERIHRSNLIGMGVMPLQFKGQDSWESLGITGKEQIDINPPAKLSPKADVGVTITYADGKKKEIAVQLRLDTPIEVEYFTAGGILPFVLRELVA